MSVFQNGASTSSSMALFPDSTRLAGLLAAIHEELDRARWRRRGRTIKAAYRRRNELGCDRLDDKLERTNRAQGRAGVSEPNYVTISGWTGSVNSKTAPRGALARAHICPPRDSMIDRQIDSPSPMPFGLVVWEALKRFSSTAGASPGPVSRTATSTRSDPVLLVTICSSRGPSANALIASAELRTRL